MTMLVKQKDELKRIRKNSFHILLFCATLMGSSNILFITAIKNTSVANVVIIFGTSALFASFFAYFIYKEKIGKNILLASFFMIIGLFIIFSDKLGLGNLIGNIYALFLGFLLYTSWFTCFLIPLPIATISIPWVC